MVVIAKGHSRWLGNRVEGWLTWKCIPKQQAEQDLEFDRGGCVGAENLLKT